MGDVSLTCTLMTLPLRLLFWLSLTVWLLLHRASKPRIPPTQSPMRQTWRVKGWEIFITYICRVPDNLKGVWLTVHWIKRILKKSVSKKYNSCTWPEKAAPSRDFMKSEYTWLARKMTVATASWYCGDEVARRGRAASGMWSWLLDRQPSS